MTGAGILNRQITFMRRALMPTVGIVRGDFAVVGDPVWAGYRPKNTQEMTVGGLQLPTDTGVLTVRDDEISREVSNSDRAEVDGKIFEVFGRQIGEKSDGMIRFDVRSVPTRKTYASQFEAKGEVVRVQRIVANAPPVEALARAIIRGFQPEEITGGIQAGERRVYVSAEDLDKQNFPQPIVRNDRLFIRDGRMLTILAVDDSTHRTAGTLNAYDIRAAGG